MSLPRSTTLREAAATAMREHGFLAEFPPDVMREVAAITPESASYRPPDSPDLRDLPWSSIDNLTSRDLDQIEVAETLPGGAIRVRIGVADVEALVAPGSEADQHAGANTTSVYTGVVVFPMLPERLSTDLTSLNEGEDRLAVIVQFDVAQDGALAEPTVFRALTRNHARLTYDEVGAWLENGASEPRGFSRHPAMRDQLRLHAEAASRLRAARTRAGALDFESVEAQPVVVNGRVVDLAVTRSNRARDLIEDFMVAANRAVALYLIERGSVSIRRVVREPRRWDRIVALAAEVGETLPAAPDNAALAAFLERRRAADPAHFADLSLSVVKLLGPGVYVVERRLGDRRNSGHFGLGVADYVHSTAPNRRYADLITQRLLRAASSGNPPPYTDEQLAAIAARCTERSEAARKVERTMRKIAGAAMMEERIGESFPAIITAASAKGTYARLLSPPVEGRVTQGADGLDVGETVRLRLVRADRDRGFIDFAHDAAGEDRGRKRDRRARKKIAADRMRPHIGKTFDATVTGVNDHGTWVRLRDGSAEGRVMRGFKGLTVGMEIPVTLIDTDSVHGFIDFEYSAGVAPAKRDRLARKRDAAARLGARIGEVFDATVTGVSRKATWLRLDLDDIEGRLVRGRAGVDVGDRIRAVLLTADPARGFIDFARDEGGES